MLGVSGASLSLCLVPSFSAGIVSCRSFARRLLSSARFSSCWLILLFFCVCVIVAHCSGWDLGSLGYASHALYPWFCFG